jgi:hypothetical protein
LLKSFTNCQLLWCVHAIALTAVYGVAHQGGILPALIQVESMWRTAPAAPEASTADTSTIAVNQQPGL